MDKEELKYDPRSTLLLDLVDEYIQHQLVEEAETLLKDYLRENPISQKAIKLWIKIAEIQEDAEKIEKLQKKLTEVPEREKIPAVEIEEEEFLSSIKEVEHFAIKEIGNEFNFLIEKMQNLSQMLSLGQIEEIIFEDIKPLMLVKRKDKWMEVSFKDNTQFPVLTWVLRNIKSN